MTENISEKILLMFAREVVKVTIPPEMHQMKKNNLDIEQLIQPIEPQKLVVTPVPVPKFISEPIKKQEQIKPVPMHFPIQKNSLQTPQSNPLNGKNTADKLNFLLKDPAITEIECMGEDKPLLVRKGNSMQQTGVLLQKSEINQLIKEFSDKTRIPIIEGTLKAALGNFILTAVISEMLGPRFILQKKNPFQPLIN